MNTGNLDLNVEYEPGPFKSLAETQLGKDLWEFLNQKDMVIRMDTATELEKPAVIGIEQQLLDKFQSEVVNDRVKQMIGHMVRAIMEECGYVVDKHNVTIASALFSKGTRYHHPSWRRLYVFRNQEKTHLCFLKKNDIQQLPQMTNGGQWKHIATFTNPIRGAIVYDIDTREAFKKIVENGFYQIERERSLRPA